MNRVVVIIALILSLMIPASICLSDDNIKAEPINGQPSAYVKLPGNGVIPQTAVEPKPEEQVVKPIEKEAQEKVGIKEPEKGK